MTRQQFTMPNLQSPEQPSHKPRRAIAAGAVAAAGILLIVGIAVANSDTPSSTPTPAVVSTPAPPMSTPSETSGSPQTEPSYTLEQEQAIGMAENYLSNSPFSRVGLIKQLQFEGFSRKVATFAVDHIKADWRAQAVRMAEQYLKSQRFSRSGLINQLVFEGFTRSEASYGVGKAYK